MASTDNLLANLASVAPLADDHSGELQSSELHQGSDPLMDLPPPYQPAPPAGGAFVLDEDEDGDGGHGAMTELSLSDVPLGGPLGGPPSGDLDDAPPPPYAAVTPPASPYVPAAQPPAAAATPPPSSLPPMPAFVSTPAPEAAHAAHALAPDGDSQPANAPVRISVDEPERVDATNSLGLKTSHWEYTVRTDSALPELLSSGMEVRRRYTDFDALHKQLHVEFRGIFVPPLPPKSLIENNSEEFLRLRRADLQAYLRALVAHPELVTSEALRLFILQPGPILRNPAWIALVAPSSLLPAATPSAARSTGGEEGGEGGSKAAELLGSVVSWWRDTKKNLMAAPKRELASDETMLRQATKMTEQLARLLLAATTSARSLCQDMDKMGTDCKDLGDALTALATYEEVQTAVLGQYTPDGISAAKRAADFSAVSKASAAQAGIWKGASMRAAGQLVTLHDHHILVPEAVAAMREREGALDAVFAAEDELAEKQSAMAALQVGGGSSGLTAEQRANKQLALAQAIDKLGEDLATARDIYETIKRRNQTELSRMGVEREAGFRRMAAELAATQARRARSVRCMANVPAAPPKFHILQYTYVADIMEKRGPFRAEHIGGLQKATESGRVHMGGAFGPEGAPPEGGMLIFKPDVPVPEIEAFVAADPYVKNGLVTAWTIKPFMVVAGP
ncbi:hypothetical protein FOA52_006479 [Chlamydomonas sp. UWO 241]|nr:hypothetical protein FOA52_006479 [Chlamydomonas sp. UWO 241]